MSRSDVPGRHRISLVDLSGEATTAYTPLGIMLLKAVLDGDESFRGRLTATAHPFLAGTSVVRMAEEIADATPDLVGFSCQGWNVAVYRQLLPTLRQLLPEAVIVLGGNHVSHQGPRWLRQVPEADIVVSGEGEHTIRDLAAWLLDGAPALSDVLGITYRAGDGLATNPERPRAASLEEVPSPYLDGAADLNGFDVALWETNRGCPYHCSFCYWGGAVGQKLTKSDMDRLTLELDAIGRAGIPAVFLCDANFGILRRDVEIAKMVVQARRRYGSPATLHVNWAKNHAETVGEILDILRLGGVHTNVYLALQTMSQSALRLAGRDERGRPAMMRLGQDILERGGDVGAELIFGLPGETLAEFRVAYDELFLRFPSLLLHPLWILPNTTYDAQREVLGLVTIRPDPTVDYEGVLSHHTLSTQDNRAGLRLLLADEILVGSGYARATVRGLVGWGGLAPTAVLDSWFAFVEADSSPLAREFAAAFETIDAECYFHRKLRSQVRGALFADRERARHLLEKFVDRVLGDQRLAAVCRDLARYDSALLPRADLDGEGTADSELRMTFDSHAVARQLVSSAPPPPPARDTPVSIRLRHEAGFAGHRLDAIDVSARWRGQVVDVVRTA